MSHKKKTTEADYNRTPIVLDKHTVAVLHIFTRTDKFEDLFMDDYIYAKFKDGFMNTFQNSAQQFIDQFEEHSCDAFIEALIKKAFKYLIENDIKFRGKDAIYNGLIAELENIKKELENEKLH